MTKNIVFIHGMFMNPKSWEKWTGYFTRLGYECSAPAWPYHDGDPADLRANVPPTLGDLALAEVISAVEKTIQRYAEPPIIIGHSVGGLIAQVLVNKGKAAAGVCVSTAAPNAMLSMEWTFLQSTVPILNPIQGDSPQEMTPERFHETFANLMSRDASDAAHTIYATHESRNVLRTSLGKAGEVDLSLPHVPLLFLAGSEDKIIPVSLVQKNFEAYPNETGKKQLIEFVRGHFICNEPGWEEVVAAVHAWLDQTS